MISRVRALLDSNVWLAILVTDGFCRQMWRQARRTCSFIGSRDILAEVEEKLLNKFGFSPRHARLMTLFVQRQVEMVAVTSIVQECRDQEDNVILAAALDSSCAHLVTGDKDLLVLKCFHGISIVTPREFFAVLPKRSA